MAPVKSKRIGILGGGQLGRMLIQKGLDWNIPFSVLDPDRDAPCSGFDGFSVGKLTDHDAVIKFGMPCDILTIEIENVNTRALKELEQSGKQVFPQPEVIELIQDKRTQKKFFQDHGIPTADFVLTANQEDVKRQVDFLPAVNKLGREGYDGRGVQVLRSVADLPKAFDKPGLLEKFVNVHQEISVIVARNARGEIRAYPPVEMIFHPEANLVDYLFSPAGIPADLARRAIGIAEELIADLKMIGLLAVEMFITPEGGILVNEVAPRPHNSGHQTIEGNVTSQYEQHLRAILNLPLGETSIVNPTAMVNLLGEEGHVGEAKYLGMEAVLGIPGVYVHLYGKKMTKPFRKMGHVSIVDTDIESLKKKAKFVKNSLKITAWPSNL
jgi:5-(carboxyamino)imidazole ribonucleotide synthase